LNKNIVDKLKKLSEPNETLPSKITVLIGLWMSTFDCYSFSWENFYSCHVKNPSLKSRLMQEFSRILAGLVAWKISPLRNNKKPWNTSFSDSPCLGSRRAWRPFVPSQFQCFSLWVYLIWRYINLQLLLKTSPFEIHWCNLTQHRVLLKEFMSKEGPLHFKLNLSQNLVMNNILVPI